MIDFEAIARLCGAEFKSLPLESIILAEGDIFSQDNIFFESLSGSIINTKHIIPCLHEDKTIVAYDIQTGYLTTPEIQARVKEIKNKLKEEGFKECSIAFGIPPSVVEESAKDHLR